MGLCGVCVDMLGLMVGLVGFKWAVEGQWVGFDGF